MTPKRIALAGAAILAFAGPWSAPLGAQTFPTNDPAIKRIWRLGMDSSHVQKMAGQLLDSLGPRLLGSPDMRRAQDWLLATYKSWGVDARWEKFGTWRSWRRGPSHIDLIAPRVRTLEGTMLGWSPGTGARNVEAVPIILPLFQDSTGAEFAKWLPNVKGKLVMISAAMPTCRPPDDWARNATPESDAAMTALKAAINADWRARIRGTGGLSPALGGGSLGLRLDSAGAAGVISFRPKDSRGAMEIFETYNTKSPTIALSCEDYGLVYRLTDGKMGPKLRLNLDAELLGEQPIGNVIATMKGTKKPDEYVVMSAHFDSWDGSSGATDNGTGTLVMLEAMRILKQVLPNPQRTILVGHWSGEEEGLVGSRAFVEDHPEVIKGMQGLFNQDNGTGRIQSLSATGYPDAPNHLLNWFDRLPKELQEQAPYFGGGGNSTLGTPGGGSDNASFACYGAPTFGLGAASWDYSAFTWHTDKDTYDKVVFDDLRHNATLTAMLVYLASEDPTFVSRDTTVLTVTRPRPSALQAALAGGGGRGGRGGGRGGGDPNVAQARIVRTGDSITVVLSVPTKVDTAAAGRGGAGGRGGRGGGRGGAEAAGPRSTATCPKAPRATNPRLR